MGCPEWTDVAPESRHVVARDWGKNGWGVSPNGCGVSFGYRVPLPDCTTPLEQGEAGGPVLHTEDLVDRILCDHWDSDTETGPCLPHTLGGWARPLLESYLTLAGTTNDSDKVQVAQSSSGEHREFLVYSKQQRPNQVPKIWESKKRTTVTGVLFQTEERKIWALRELSNRIDRWEISTETDFFPQRNWDQYRGTKLTDRWRAELLLYKFLKAIIPT